MTDRRGTLARLEHADRHGSAVRQPVADASLWMHHERQAAAIGWRWQTRKPFDFGINQLFLDHDRQNELLAIFAQGQAVNIRHSGAINKFESLLFHIIFSPY